MASSMRAWSVVVPRSRAEEIRRKLLDQGLLLKPLRIRSDGDAVRLPTRRRVDHGLRYHVDLAQAYFSPRLASERKRIADLVRPGEVVADPFAGVGPYSILIAKRRRPESVYAADANPTAVKLLRENVAANRTDI